MVEQASRKRPAWFAQLWVLLLAAIVLTAVLGGVFRPPDSAPASSRNNAMDGYQGRPAAPGETRSWVADSVDISPWPFSSRAMQIVCRHRPTNLDIMMVEVFALDGGERYALNGTARSQAPLAGAPLLIADNADTSSAIAFGLRLCRGR